MFLVGVLYALDELDRRERFRDDRWIGENRSHVDEDQVHSFGPYDYAVDTTARDITAIADEVIQRWRTRGATVL